MEHWLFPALLHWHWDSCLIMAICFCFVKCFHLQAVTTSDINILCYSTSSELYRTVFPPIISLDIENFEHKGEEQFYTHYLNISSPVWVCNYLLVEQWLGVLCEWSLYGFPLGTLMFFNQGTRGELVSLNCLEFEMKRFLEQPIYFLILTSKNSYWEFNVD